jgi:uncharacterized membrane protein
MLHSVRLSTRRIALIALFSALYYVMSYMPGIKIATGGVNTSIQIEAFMASVFGLVLGPYVGAVTAFMGALLAWLLPPGIPSLTSAIFLPSPVINAFIIGLIYRGKWKPAFVTLAAVILAFWLLPATQPWPEYSYVGFFVMWDKIAALLLILPSAVLLKKGIKNVASPEVTPDTQTKTRRINGSFVLVFAAAVSILVNAWTVATSGNPKYQFDLLGTTFKMSLITKEIFPAVSSIGYGWLALGVGILLCSFLLLTKPKKRKLWSTIIFVLSCVSAVIGGGYVIGLFLGVLGSMFEYLTRKLPLSKRTLFGDMTLFLMLAYVGNEADAALGSLIFGLPQVSEGLFLMNLDALRLSFVVAPVFYFAVRLLQAIITALIATPLLRSLKSSGFTVGKP